MIILAILATVWTASVVVTLREVRRAPIGGEGRDGFYFGQRETSATSFRDAKVLSGNESCIGAEADRSKVAFKGGRSAEAAV